MYQLLKQLNVNQQIGALFTIVFGLLLLVSVAAVFLSMREFGDSHRAEQQRTELDNLEGLLRTSWLVMLVFWVGWMTGDWVALVLFGLVSLFALREFMTLSVTRRGDHRDLHRRRHSFPTRRSSDLFLRSFLQRCCL